MQEFIQDDRNNMGELDNKFKLKKIKTHTTLHDKNIPIDLKFSLLSGFKLNKIMKQNPPLLPNRIRSISLLPLFSYDYDEEQWRISCVTSNIANIS